MASFTKKGEGSKRTSKRRRSKNSCEVGDDLLKELRNIKYKRPKVWNSIVPRLDKLIGKYHAAAGIGFFRWSKSAKCLEVLVGKSDSSILIRTDGTKDLYKLPGGKAQGDEDPWKTAIRELREETGNAILGSSWKGQVCLRSFYFHPSRYTLFVWFLPPSSKLPVASIDSPIELSEDGELSHLVWVPISDPSIPRWIDTMFKANELRMLFKSFAPR